MPRRGARNPTRACTPARRGGAARGRRTSRPGSRCDGAATGDRWTPLGIRARNREGRHLRRPDSDGGERHRADLCLERSHRRDRQPVAAPPHLPPRVLALEPEGGRDREEGGRVGRAAPAEPALERLRPGPRPVPGDDRAADPALRLAGLPRRTRCRAARTPTCAGCPHRRRIRSTGGRGRPARGRERRRRSRPRRARGRAR